MFDQSLNELGKAIQQGRDDAHQLGTIRATLLVNFGPTSRSMERYGFQVAKEGHENLDDTSMILVEVLTRLTELAAVAHKANQGVRDE